jgi:adenylosuccinate lyase
MMEAVKAGGDRQEIHEAIRVHAREAARVVKMEGGKNPLRDLLHSDPAFAKVAHRIDSLLDPARYVGRAPQQVDEYLTEDVAPLLARHAALLGAKGKVEV